MIKVVRIKLVTPMLGSKYSPEKIRRFTREFNGDIHVNKKAWIASLEEGEVLCNSGIDLGSIILPNGIMCPTLRTYKRVYNKSKVELFESIQANTVISFRLGFKNNIVDNDLTKLLNTVGEFIGLSEWGSQFGFGRFKVLEITDALC